MDSKGGPAFPYAPTAHSMFVQPPLSKGMTLRDYFAAKAMQGMMHPEQINQRSMRFDGDQARMLVDLAAASYMVADAMLTAREKP